MKITNFHNIPDAIVRAIENDDYFKGDGVDYSVSELINPPRITILKKRHWAELTQDVMEMVWLLFGKLMHVLLERAGAKNVLTEERLYVSLNGKKLSGQFDLFDGKKLSDYKTTSVYSHIYGSRNDDWEKQLNLYAEFLLLTLKYNVEEIEVVSINRDWRHGESLRGGDYPQPISVVPLRLWPQEERTKFLTERVNALIVAENDSDETLPACTPEEMWEKPTTYAVMKEGRKSALKVLPSEAEAYALAENQDISKVSVVKRPGERTRCLRFCPVRDHCNINQEYKKTQEATDGVQEG